MFQLVDDGIMKTDAHCRTDFSDEDEDVFLTVREPETTVHPPFPLHLKFRWPILHRVVTLETAPYREQLRNMKKESSRPDTVCDTGFHLERSPRSWPCSDIICHLVLAAVALYLRITRCSMTQSGYIYILKGPAV